MTASGDVLSMLVLSEDSAADATVVVESVVRECLKQVEPFVQTQRIRFEPVAPEVRVAVRGTAWKSKAARDRQRRTELVRYVATKIVEDFGFVFFHFDGDVAWRSRDVSDNVSKFSVEFLRDVQMLVCAALERMGRLGELEQKMSKLVAVTPFYSIESWLYQNTDFARQSCLGQCGRHVALIESWRRERGLLDEVLKPKDALCLGSAHNKELARSLPAREMVAAGKSFERFVEAARSNDYLRALLRSTSNHRGSQSHDNA